MTRFSVQYAIILVIFTLPHYVLRIIGAPRVRKLNEVAVEAAAAHARALIAERSDLREAGREWYLHAHIFAGRLAERYGVTLAQAAGVISAVSPGMLWELNMTAAEYVIGYAYPNSLVIGGAAWDKRRANSPYGWVPYAKAYSILSGDGSLAAVLRHFNPDARKTHAFVRNILFPGQTRYVTVDGHMANALTHGLKRIGISKVDSLGTVAYDTFAAAIARVAAENGMSPDEMQAWLWLAYREIKFQRGVEA